LNQAIFHLRTWKMKVKLLVLHVNILKKLVNNQLITYFTDPVINLCIGCTFRLWESIDIIMEAYGKRHGFTAIKKRLIRHEDGSIKHRSFGCEFGSHYQPKKQVDINNHRDRKSKRQQYAWNANYNCSKNSQIITLTTFNDSHNHALFPDTEKYSSKYRCIPDNILKEIQFITKHGNLSISI